MITPNGATERCVANPGGKAVEQAILPSSRGGIEALDSRRRKRNHEGLALCDSTFGLFVEKRREKVSASSIKLGNEDGAQSSDRKHRMLSKKNVPLRK